MQVISAYSDLVAISGGDIECTVGTDGVNCSGTAEEWGDVIFGAFDTLQGWGGDLGSAIYDATH